MKNPSSKIVGSLQQNKWNGEVYDQLVFYIDYEGMKAPILLNIPTDKNGAPKVYESSKGKPIIYGRVTMVEHSTKLKSNSLRKNTRR